MPSENEQAPQERAEARGPNPVSGTANYNFSVVLHERQGRAIITWSSNCPARLLDSWVALYKNAYQNDPNAGHVAWTWAEANGSYETGQPWGSGWGAALVARTHVNGPWVFIARTPFTV